MREASAIAIIEALRQHPRSEFVPVDVLVRMTGLSPKTVRAYICLIRDEFGEAVIETRRGAVGGYRLGRWGGRP